MALSGNQITGTGAIGFSWRAYAGFTAKAAAEVISTSVNAGRVIAIECENRVLSIADDQRINSIQI